MTSSLLLIRVQTMENCCWFVKFRKTSRDHHQRLKALLRNDHSLIKVYRVSCVMTAKKSTKKVWYTNFGVFVLLFWHSGLHCYHWLCKLPSSSNTQCNNAIHDIDWEQSILYIQETPQVMINLKNQWVVGKRMSTAIHLQLPVIEAQC